MSTFHSAIPRHPALLAERTIRVADCFSIALSVGFVVYLFWLFCSTFRAFDVFSPYDLIEESAYTYTSVKNFLRFGALNSWFLQDFSASPDLADHPFVYNHMPAGLPSIGRRNDVARKRKLPNSAHRVGCSRDDRFCHLSFHHLSSLEKAPALRRWDRVVFLRPVVDHFHDGPHDLQRGSAFGIRASVSLSSVFAAPACCLFGRRGCYRIHLVAVYRVFAAERRHRVLDRLLRDAPHSYSAKTYRCNWRRFRFWDIASSDLEFLVSRLGQCTGRAHDDTLQSDHRCSKPGRDEGVLPQSRACASRFASDRLVCHTRADYL